MSSRDKRIVEMRFDNAAFEKGAAQSMSTLQKLKESLNFSKVTDGMSESFSTIKAEITGLNGTFESVAGTFKNVFLGTLAGQTAYKGVVAGFNFIKKGYDATIGQIISGGKARAQNIEQAKFQLGGLGINWDDIYEDLDYAVAGTAYGLDAAAKVGSQFVASGVALGDDMKAALRGISGVAAMTNSSYEEIGHIFTTVAGQGKLMTMQLNQLAGRGLNVAGTLAEAFGTTEANVREMVTRGEVDFKTFAEAMNDAFGEHATKANDTFSGSLSNMKAALSRIGALFATPAYDNLRIVINAVTPVINAFKKAVTPVADEVQRLMEVGANLAKSFLENFDTSVFSKVATPLAGFISMIADSVGSLTDTITGSPLNEAADTIKKFTEAEKQAARDIWVWGTYGDGEVRKKKLKEAGLEYRNVQDYLEEYVMTCKEAEYEEALAAESAEELAKSSTKAGKIMRNAKWYSIFRGLGFNEDTTKSIVNVIETVRNLGVVVKNVATSVFNVVTAAISGILGYSGYEDLTGNVEDITLKMAAFSEELVITKEKAAPVGEVFRIITGTIVKVATVIAKAVNTLTIAGRDIVEVMDYGASADISSSGGFGALVVILGVAADALRDIIEIVKECGSEIGKLDGVEQLKRSVVDVLNVIGSLFNPTVVYADGPSSINAADAGIINLSADVDALVPVIASAVDKLTKGLANFISKVPEWITIIKDFFGSVFDSGGPSGQPKKPKTVIEVVKDIISGIKDLFIKSSDVRKRAFDWAVDTFNGIIDGLKSVLSGFDMKSLGQFSLFSGIIIALLQFNKTVKTVNDTLTSVQKIPNKITGMLTSVTGFFDVMKKSLSKLTAAGAISVVALSVAALVMSLTYLADVPVDALARAVVYVVLIMEALRAVVKETARLGSINRTTNNIHNSGNLGSNNNIKVFDPIMGLGVMLFGLATAIGVVYFIVKDIDTMNPETINTSIARVGILLLMILGTMAGLMGVIKAFNITRVPVSFIVTIGVVAAALAGVMLAIAGAGAILGTVNANKLDTIMYTLTNMMAALVAVLLSMALIGYAGVTSNQLSSIGEVIIMFGLAIALVCAGLGAIMLASKESSVTDDGLKTITSWLEVMAGTVIVALLAGALMLNYLNNVSAADMKTLATSILIASGSFALIAIALAVVMRSMGNTNELAGVAIAVTLLLAAISAMLLGATWLVQQGHINAGDMIKIAEAIAIMAGTFVIMAAALSLIGKIDTDLLRVVGVVGIATLAIIALAVVGMRYGEGINRIAMALLMFATSGLIFAASVWLLAKGIEALSVALPAFAEGIAAFLDSLKNNKEAITTLVVIVVVFVGVLALAIAAAVRFGPAIEAAFDVFIRITDNLLSYWGSLPADVQKKVAAIAGAVILGLAAATPDMLEAIGNVIVKVMTYLGLLVAPIVNGLVILIINIINGVADAVRNNSGPIIAAIVNLLSAIMELAIKATEIIVYPIVDLLETLATDELLGVDALMSHFFGGIIAGIADSIGGMIMALRNLDNKLVDFIAGSKLLSWIFGISEQDAAEMKKRNDEMYVNALVKDTEWLYKTSTDLLKRSERNYEEILTDFGNIPDILAGNKKGSWRDFYAVDAGLDDYSNMWRDWAKNTTDAYNTADSMNAAMTSLHEAIQKQKDVVAEADDPKTRAAAQHALDAMGHTMVSAAKTSGSSVGTVMGASIKDGLKMFLEDENTMAALSSGISGLLGSAGSNVDMSDFVKQIDMGNLDITDSNALASYFNVDASTGIDLSNYLNEAALTGLDGYTAGIEAGSPEAVAAAEKVADDTVNAFENKQKDAEDAGEFFTGGLARGIWNNRNVVMERVQMVADYAVAQLRRSLDEHSPSKVTEELGKFFTLGFANGVEGYSNVAVEKTASMAERTTEAFRSSLQTISDAISTDVEANPTIRPVMDLSNVRDSVTSINSMFSSQSARYAAINNRLSNETAAYRFELDQSSRYDNSDVVSAIGGMQEEMTGLKDAMMDTQIVMDSGVLVGQLAPGMDRTLGRMSTRKSRRN